MSRFSRWYELIGAVAFAWAFYPLPVSACEPDMDGCLGCSDSELQACVEQIAAEICVNGGGFDYCDKVSAEEDIEKLVLRNTGVHMSRVRALLRSPTRYQHPHAYPH